MGQLLLLLLLLLLLMSLDNDNDEDEDDGKTTGSVCSYFILSHVPRACYNSEHPPVDNLQTYIIQQAQSLGGFELLHVLRPLDLVVAVNDNNDDISNISLPSMNTTRKDVLNSMSLQEMEEIGATLLVFQLKASSSSIPTP